MTGVPLTFKIATTSSYDAMGNPITTEADTTINDCLIAPITTPQNAREQLAIEQSKLQVEIFIPKTDNTDLSDSTVQWGGRTYKIDSDNAEYMLENTPTRWNRRIRGEVIEA